MQGVALGGLGYGLLVKNWPNMPKLPGIGRSGTVALAVYFRLSDRNLFAGVLAGAAAA